MKICIFGAGAIGGYMAVEIASAGYDVCVIARGAHLEAIKKDGLTLHINDQVKNVRLPASDNPADFGPQDYVICTLKTHQSMESAEKFAPLLGTHTAVVTAQNGIPWWYFYKEGGKFEGTHLESVDAGARQWHLIGPERAIGCVVDPACEVIAPGVIRHEEFNRFIIGEPNGSESERVKKLQKILTNAGFDTPIRNAIRWNVWLKLWGNVCFNPISALTHAPLDKITSGALGEVCRRAMYETKAVTDALDIHIPENMIERRLTVAGKAVGHKMSMLQDLEQGRSMGEIDALVAVVHELGQMTGIATPTVDTLLALAQERGRQAGLY